MHEGVTFLLSGLNLFKQTGLEHADESVLVSHQEVRAHEDFVFLLTLLLVVVVLIAGNGVSLGERNTLDVGEEAVFEPCDNLEVEVIETDGSFIVTTDQIVVVRGQDVDGMVTVVQLNDLD